MWTNIITFFRLLIAAERGHGVLPGGAAHEADGSDVWDSPFLLPFLVLLRLVTSLLLLCTWRLCRSWLLNSGSAGLLLCLVIILLGACDHEDMWHGHKGGTSGQWWRCYLEHWQCRVGGTSTRGSTPARPPGCWHQWRSPWRWSGSRCRSRQGRRAAGPLRLPPPSKTLRPVNFRKKLVHLSSKCQENFVLNW